MVYRLIYDIFKYSYIFTLVTNNPAYTFLFDPIIFYLVTYYIHQSNLKQIIYPFRLFYLYLFFGGNILPILKNCILTFVVYILKNFRILFQLYGAFLGLIFLANLRICVRTYLCNIFYNLYVFILYILYLWKWKCILVFISKEIS